MLYTVVIARNGVELTLPVCGAHVHGVLSDLENRRASLVTRVEHGTAPCKVCEPR